MVKQRKLDMVKLTLLAEQYRDLANQARDLEAQMKPIKEAIVKACEEHDVVETLDLQCLLVIPQVRTTAQLIQRKVTPDWLYRYTLQGGRLETKLKLEKGDDIVLKDLLDEVGYTETDKLSFALKLKA